MAAWRFDGLGWYARGMTSPISDVRALPQRVLDLYLYPLGAWGVGLAALYLADRAHLALLLLHALALWQTGLTVWWGRDLLRRYRTDQLTRAEADAGVRSVGHILAASALTPAIVFLATDPLSPHGLGASLGGAVVAGMAWVAVAVLVRLSNRWAHAVALGMACTALPLNATGAVTIATLAGWWSDLVEHAPLPGSNDSERPQRPPRDRPKQRP